MHAIKYFPIYNNLINDKCFKRLGRIIIYIPTINVVGKISNLMLGSMISPKYLDPSSLIVDVKIDGIMVPNTLFDIGVAINVTTKETMLKLNLQGAFRTTNIVLQLADRSTIALEGIIEDVMVSI